MKTYLFAFLAIAMLFAAGCAPTENTAPNVTIQGAIITSGNTSVDQTATPAKDAKSDLEMYKNITYSVSGVEGDLIQLKLKAVDPDGSDIKYYYTKPFNDKGLWQTEDGDAGKHLITVTASDGQSNTSTDILVIVNARNRAPTINCPDTITVKEGDTVNIGCTFFDQENDPIVVEYSGWMNSNSYTTNFESSGDHKVYVRASDLEHNSTKTITVVVEEVNRAPIFSQKLKDLTVTETDIVTIAPNVTDPDGNKVSITYSEPLSSKGVWKTELGDAGTYPISVVASDGTLNTKETFTLTVKMLNTAPVMNSISNITVEEGEKIILKPQVSDREDDPISIKYSGWMKTSTYETTFDDAYPRGCNKSGCSATYKVTVTATDGAFTATQDVFITVKDKNRAPVFIMP